MTLVGFKSAAAGPAAGPGLQFTCTLCTTTCRAAPATLSRRELERRPLPSRLDPGRGRRRHYAIFVPNEISFLRQKSLLAQTLSLFFQNPLFLPTVFLRAYSLVVNLYSKTFQASLACSQRSHHTCTSFPHTHFRPAPPARPTPAPRPPGLARPAYPPAPPALPAPPARQSPATTRTSYALCSPPNDGKRIARPGRPLFFFPRLPSLLAQTPLSFCPEPRLFLPRTPSH